MLQKVKKALKEGGVMLVIKRGINKIQWFIVKKDYTKEIVHSFNVLPAVEVEYRPAQISGEDVEIARRVLKALKKALEHEKKTATGDIWDRILEHHKDFYAIWDDPYKVAEYMNNMNQRNITMGISASTFSSFQDLQDDTSAQQAWGVLIKDDLVSLGEAVGVLPYNLKGNNLAVNEARLLSDIEKVIGISLIPSETEGGLYALKVNGKYFPHREFHSIYYAWRTFKLVGNMPIGEIGGGMGKAARYATQFGITNYALYDLPLVNLLQAWYLIKSGTKVVLYGEEGEGVKILPYWEFSKGAFMLVLNTNSFAEMDESIVEEYLHAIKKNSTYLLSVNQEDQRLYGDGRKHVVVPHIVDRVGEFTREYRFPSWFPCENYVVEELYTTK